MAAGECMPKAASRGRAQCSTLRRAALIRRAVHDSPVPAHTFAHTFDDSDLSDVVLANSVAPHVLRVARPDKALRRPRRQRDMSVDTVDSSVVWQTDGRDEFANLSGAALVNDDHCSRLLQQACERGASRPAPPDLR